MTRIDLITLQQIRDKRPCAEGWEKLLNSFDGVNTPLNTVVSIGDIAKSNDSLDALWCCRAVKDKRFIISLIMPTVKRALRFTDDEKAIDCFNALQKWFDGDETEMSEMVDAPERIWIKQDECPYFYEESELTEVGSPVTEYIRKDKLDELEADNEQVAKQRDMWIEAALLQQRKREEAEADNKRLREALEPFALVAEHDIGDDETDSDAFRPMPKPFNHAPEITVGHLRAARRVLEGGEANG